MPQIPDPGPAHPLRTLDSAAWHDPFLAMLPGIRQYARWAFRRLPAHDREEAEQAVVAHALAAYWRLVQRGRGGLAYATPLARHAIKRHRSGRGVGAGAKARDVASAACQRRHGFAVESYDWQLALVEDRRTTPAELAALRVDFADWLETLSPRDRRLACVLAAGERTSAVAHLFRLSAGRISQLRGQLFESWREFMGESAAA